MSFYDISRALTKVFKSNAFDYSNLETPDGTGDDHAIATRENGLVSFIEIKGSLRHVGPQRLQKNIERIVEVLKDGTLYNPGIRVDIIYIRDKDRSYRILNRSLDPMRKAIHRTSLDFDWIINETEDMFRDTLVTEQVYLAVYTNLDNIDKDSQKEALSNRQKEADKKKRPLIIGEFCQNIDIVVKALRSSHQSNVESIIASFDGVCSTELMSSREAVRAIRLESSPNYTSDNWQPSLPGDRIPVRLIRESKSEGDLSHIGHPTIGYQLFAVQPEQCKSDRSIVSVGDTYQAPLMVDLGQREPVPFLEFENSLPYETPVRMVFTLESGHDQIVSNVNRRKNAAVFLSITSEQTREISRSAKEIIDRSMNDQEVFVKLTMTACTWGDTIEQAQKNKRLLAKNLQNWGGIDIIEERADPIQAWSTTLPGFSHKDIRIANTFPYSVNDVMKMLPFDRAFSPFESGSVLMTTLRENLFPIALGASEQAAWVDFIFAGSGSGKSTFLTDQSLAFLMSPRNQVLPLLSVLDVGPNGAQMVDIIRDALPENQKHLAQSFKLQNTKKKCINFMDTYLGCRYPISPQKDVIVNIMSAILEPAGSDHKIMRLSEFASDLIRSMYQFFEDDNNPKAYEPAIDPEVDQVMDRHNVAVGDGTTWWGVVDKLYDLGEYVAAMQAQRHAVPTLKDATRVISEDDNLSRLYRSSSIGFGDETMIDFAMQAINSATTMFPILSGATKFDLGAAKIASLDLKDVVGGTGDKDAKQTSIMYMLGRYILTSKFYLHEDLLDEFPEKYKRYHKRQMDEYGASPKRLVMDELHYGMTSNFFVRQLVTDGRVNRKYDIQMAMVSQYISDLNDQLSKIVTSLYVLSLGNDDTEKEVKNRLGLTQDVVKAMRRYCKGPDPKRGTTMLVRAYLRGQEDSAVEHLASLKMGPGKLLGISTVHEDTNMRKELVSKVGLSNAIHIMKREFPSGSTQKQVRKRIADGDFEGESVNVYEAYSEELTDKYRDEITQ